MRVTIFENLYKKNEPHTIPIAEALRRIQTGKKSATTIEAIRNGEKLKCDQTLGYYGVVACMMGVQSFRQRAYLQWDPDKHEVVKA